MLEDAWEFRKYFELESIRLAIQNAGEPEIKNLEEKYIAFEKIAKGKQKAHEDRIHQIIEADLEFHYEVCKSTKNALFPLAFAAVRGAFYLYIKSLIKVRRDQDPSGEEPMELISAKSLDKHRAIMDGIRNKDFSICEKAFIEMTDHKLNQR
jgi:DNA-binding FadR family transcriptional regulator